MRPRALVVGRDPKLTSYYARILLEQGFVADVAASTAAGLERVSRGDRDFVLIDLDHLDGSCASEIRAWREAGIGTPILVAGTRPTSVVVETLSAGADDFLRKPFALEEFVARIGAVTRRSVRTTRLRVGDLEIDRLEGVARFRGVRLELGVREFAMLACLARWPGGVASEDLLAHVWQGRAQGRGDLLEQLVRRLRRHLGEASGMLETVPRVGYRLVARGESQPVSATSAPRDAAE